MHFEGAISHCLSYGNVIVWSWDSCARCRGLHTDNVCSYPIFGFVCFNYQVDFSYSLYFYFKDHYTQSHMTSTAFYQRTVVAQ